MDATTNFEQIMKHPKLTVLQRQFLVEALVQERKVEIVETVDQLRSTKDKVWVQQSDDKSYYIEMLAHPTKLGFALVLKS